MYKLLLMLVSKNCSWNMFWKEDQRICQILPINFWKKKCFRRHFRENWQKTCHVLQILAIMDVGLGEGMNTSKKKKLGWKSEGEGVFSQRPKSVKHGKSYLLRVS